MAANYTAHLTSVLVVLVVAFAAFITDCAFLHCGSFTNKQTNTVILCVVHRSSIHQCSPRLCVNVIFLRLRLHYSHVANVHGLRVTFRHVLQYVYLFCSNRATRAGISRARAKIEIKTFLLRLFLATRRG